MNADEPAPQGDQYRCPGEQHPISRAVHLGRLAAFYPACRQCDSPRRHRHDLAAPGRAVGRNQLARPAASLFHDEGAGGVYLNDLTPAAAKDIAAAFGAVMRAREEGGRETEGTFTLSPYPQSPFPLPPSSSPATAAR